MATNQIGQEGFPTPQGLRAGLGHLVEGVQQQGDAPLPPERVQRRQVGVFGRPPLAQPVERARRGIGAARTKAVQRDEKGYRAVGRVGGGAGGERGPGVVQFEMRSSVLLPEPGGPSSTSAGSGASASTSRKSWNVRACADQRGPCASSP
ncbi:MAG TPA: hypothetical protein PKY50_12800 [Candidatus Competibacter sp.]|nr:hypothetical protein [Candidatus Competibacter sp.]